MKISKGKLSGLKSHDFHVFLQQTLLLCYQRIENKTIVVIMMHFNRVFRRLCVKIINGEDKLELKGDYAKIMNLLEKEMPPSFFNIMSHLLNHLVQELFLCGPIHTR